MIYFEFIKNRMYFYAVSVIIFLGTPLLLATVGLNWGLDFVGGTEFLVQFEKKVGDEAIRKKLESPELGLGEVAVQEVIVPGSEGATGPRYAIRTKKNPDEIKGMDEKLVRTLSTLEKCKRLSTNSIGPVVGQSLRKNTLKAIVWSCLVILIYMWFRFEFRPGVLCTVALLHDTFAVLMLCCITRIEVDLTVVAAVLTVLGYSMNDSIVILDRVRENQRLKRKMEFAELVNASINQTLSRTVYTGLTVILTLLALVFLGPTVLKGFALAMTVGVFSGMFSTVSVVCPALVDWHYYADKPKSAKGDAAADKA